MKIFMPLAPGARFGFSHTKPAFVADDLDDLQGPTSGLATLPIHIDWTPSSTYDLDDPRRLQSMYITVLREARSEADLSQWLDRELLIEHWAKLRIPGFIKESWEKAHPELTQR